MDEAFLESIAHTDHWLMGRKLRPFCPWHRVWLTIIGSPIEKGGPMNLVDLEIASRVLASDYDGIRRALKCSMWNRVSMLWKMFVYNPDREIARLNDYVDDFVTAPNLWHDKPQAGSIVGYMGHAKPMGGFPDVLCQVVAYQAATHQPPRVCWMTPLGEIEWWVAASRRNAGDDVEVVTDDDLAMMEEVGRIKTEIAKKRAAEAGKGVGSN